MNNTSNLEIISLENQVSHYLHHKGCHLPWDCRDLVLDIMLENGLETGFSWQDHKEKFEAFAPKVQLIAKKISRGDYPKFRHTRNGVVVEEVW